MKPMAFSDIEAKTNIDTGFLGIGGFSSAEEVAILAAMRTAYDGSDTAKKMMDDWVATGAEIDIDYKADVFQAFTFTAGGGTGDLELDLSYIEEGAYINPNGKAVAETLVGALTHELGHGLTGRLDNGNYTTDYKGDNVNFINPILDDLGLEERLSYIAWDRTGILEVGRDYTNGTAVDVATALNQNWNSSAAGNSDDLLIDGDGSNILISGQGDDFLVGQGGNDTLAGGAGGTDTAVYFGSPTDYDVRLQNDGSWDVRHARGDMDEGTDSLENIERIMFDGGETFDLKKDSLTFQTDFALVVDTTGSMGDDIAAVKSQASTIINRLFSDGTVDARIGVVSYKDNTIGEPTTVILPFTDQDSFEDRRTAALDAINGLTVSGGGDTPETAFDGLLTALNGTMGDWRAGASTQRVVLFTDAPAKDGALAGQVRAFASDIGATISSGVSAKLGSVTKDVFHLAPVAAHASGAENASVSGLTFESEGEDPADFLPDFVDDRDPIEAPEGAATVEIYTIYTGFGTGVTDDLDAVAAATGGAALTAPDPDDLADILLDLAGIGAGVNEIVGTIDDDVLPGTAGPDLMLGDLGDDIFTPGGGFDVIELGGGSDTVSGSLADYIGDEIRGFGTDDAAIIIGASLSRAELNIDLKTGVIDIDLTGDGTVDGTLLVTSETGDFSAGDFMAVVDSGDTMVTFETFLPLLQERQAVDPDLVNGIINQNFLKGDGTTDFQVTLRDLGFAGYDNVVGVYEIDAAGNIFDTRILFDNANADKSASTRIEDVEDGHNLGFFIVQDAADWAATLVAGDTLSFVNGSGGAANISDGADISIAVNGAAVDEMVFHSFDEDMNSDGLQHALSGVEVGGEAITIGFEDLTGGGDRDYEDVAFQIELVDDFAFI